MKRIGGLAAMALLAAHTCIAQEIRAGDAGIVPGAGTDQTAALAALIAQHPGGAIVLPAGRYRVGTLKIDSDVTLRGEKGAILEGSEKGKPVLFLGNANVVLKQLVIDGGNTAKTGVYIFSYNKTVLIDSCEVRNIMGDGESGGLGIQINRNDQEVKILHTFVHDVDGPEDGIVANRIGANRGIFINNVRNVLVQQCRVEDVKGFEDGDGIHCYRWDGKKPASIRISDNQFRNIYKRAVKVQTDNVEVTGNTIEGGNTRGFNYAAISFFGNNGLIQGNRINLNSTVFGIEVNGCRQVRVEDNTIAIKAFRSRNNSGILFKDVDGVKDARNSFRVPGRSNVSRLGNNRNISEE